MSDKPVKLAFKCYIRIGSPIRRAEDQSTIGRDELQPGMCILVSGMLGEKIPMVVDENLKTAQSKLTFAILEFDEQYGEWVCGSLINKALAEKLKFEADR